MLFIYMLFIYLVYTIKLVFIIIMLLVIRFFMKMVYSDFGDITSTIDDLLAIIWL